MHTLPSLSRSPNSLAPHYSSFHVADRILLTGHSHQAWPDRAARAHHQAFLDAAEWVDEKWSRAFDRADQVRRGFARLLGDSSGVIALGQSTHDLVVRFLSALPLSKRPRLVTSDGEFHSLRRQLDRLAEEGIEVVRVPARPVAALADRLQSALARDAARTSAVLVSTVLFETAEIVPGLPDLSRACAREGVPLLLDAYHQLNVVPMTLEADKLDEVYVVGGGYKYCQLGEGNCFLRTPSECRLRPVLTGWFSEFDLVHEAAASGNVPYGEGPARFAGATYDPVSNYRAAEVLSFFEEQGMSPSLLRQVSQHQIGTLAHEFDKLGLDERVIARDTDTALDRIAGFLSLRANAAGAICTELRRRGVLADARGDRLRLGPAPYLCDSQLRDAVGLLAEAVRAGAALRSN